MHYFLSSLIDGASDAIFVADIETGLIVYVNAAACKLFECENADLIGKHQSQLHPADELEKVILMFKDFTTNEGYKEATAHILTKSNKKKLVMITGANLFEMNGKKYASAYFKDISHVEKLSEIAYHQSHSVRRPLANILGLSKILSEDTFETEEERKQLLEQLHAEALQLDNVVKSVSSHAGNK